MLYAAFCISFSIVFLLFDLQLKILPWKKSTDARMHMNGTTLARRKNIEKSLFFIWFQALSKHDFFQFFHQNSWKSRFKNIRNLYGFWMISCFFIFFEDFCKIFTKYNKKHGTSAKILKNHCFLYDFRHCPNMIFFNFFIKKWKIYENRGSKT